MFLYFTIVIYQEFNSQMLWFDFLLTLQYPKTNACKNFYTFLCPYERKLVVCDKEYSELIEVVVKYLK